VVAISRALSLAKEAVQIIVSQCTGQAMAAQRTLDSVEKDRSEERLLSCYAAASWNLDTAQREIAANCVLANQKYCQSHR
jgi:hypothetical protein